MISPRAQEGPRPRRLRPVRRVLVGLTLLAWCVAQLACAPDPQVEGASKRPMARQAVAEYLRSLRRGDHNTAARLFAGPLAVLRRETGVWGPARAGDGTDTARLLAAYQRLPGIYHGQYEVKPARMLAPHSFAVDVTFRWPSWPDTTTEFRVTYDGERYLVLGLPPRRAVAGAAAPAAAR